MVVRLIRLETGPSGTFGRVDIGSASFFSGELPSKDNKPDVSCIPAGTYDAARTYSARFKRLLYLLYAVPGRTGIRIHPANLMGDKSLGLKYQLNGCIALGERLGRIDGQKAILLSQTAVRRFDGLTDGKSFKLEVIDGYH